MSRTDKTDPWPVQAMKDPGRFLEESHHHDKGYCDLPEQSVDTVGWSSGYNEDGRMCHWAYTDAFSIGENKSEGQARYAGRRLQRQAVRHDRHTARQSIRALVRESLDPGQEWPEVP